MLKIPRLLIAGTHSGVGKTTISTGIMAALTRRGYNLQPYKVGPDYIDPGYHTLVTGNISRNLDTWLAGEEKILSLFLKSASGKDLCLIEGVMGLFDGIKGTSSEGSSAHIAKLLDVPVVLIMDVKSMARSAAAVALGYKSLEPELKIAGIILNKVGSESHYRMVKEAIEDSVGVPIVGYLPKNQEIQLPERHLGLVTTAEGENLSGLLADISTKIEKTIDLDRILELAQGAPELEETPFSESLDIKGDDKVKIGVAKDKAFTFYYQDGLEVLEDLGAQLISVSPMADIKLPSDLDGLIIGGGYPEMFLETLSANESFKENLKGLVEKGLPVYAECGGQMYLTEAIIDFEGQSYPMVGLVPGISRMQKRLVAMGYVTVKAHEDNILMSVGESYKGHEFHYSSLESPKVDGAFKLVKNRDGSHREEGFSNGNLLTSYVHLNFAGFPNLAKNYLEKCREYKKRRSKNGN